MLGIDDFSDNDTLESVKQYAVYFADDAALTKLADNYAQRIVDSNQHEFPSVGDERTSDNDVIPEELEDDSDVEMDLYCMLQDAEANCRQFTPAEFWIHALNQREDAEDAWHIVDSAIGYTFSLASRVHVGRAVDRSREVIQ